MKSIRLPFFLTLLLLAAGACHAAPPAKGDAKLASRMESSLTSFLQTYAEGDPVDRYKTAFVDLNGDGVDEAVVYARASGTCGSGGCNTLVLKWNGSSWTKVSAISVTKLPIRVLASKSHGWSDLGVTVQGGGITQPYEAILKFDGSTYPDNPTVPPAKKVTGAPNGKVIISVN